MSSLKVDQITNGTHSVATEAVARGAAKAWVVFNGTGTVVILNSYNITSVTDDAVGKYTLNFTKPMKNLNYAYSGAGRWNSGNSAVLVGQNNAQVKALSSLPIHIANSTSGGAADVVDVTVIVHGD